jgi:hypothetical protein
VGKHLKAFVSKAKLDTRHKVKVLHSNGGGEYTVGHIRDFLKECRISHKMTTADTLQHNGIMEQLNCTHSTVSEPCSLMQNSPIPTGLRH